jgi:hypothetical protein
MGAEVIVPRRNLFARLRHRQIATLVARRPQKVRGGET